MKNVAWVTGAGKGIGRSLAIDLAKGGWTVAATSRTIADLDSLQKEASSFSGNIIPYAADITNAPQIEKLVSKIEDEIGLLKIAIFNAGTYIRFGVKDFLAKDFKNQIDINVIGTVNCLTPVMHRMKDRRNGHLIIISSLTAYRGLPFASAYGASKAALTNMCEALKPELDAFDVKISVVHPGFVKTPLTDKNEFSMPFLVDAEYASKKILRGIERARFEITFPTRFALLLKLARCLPYFLYFMITRKIVGK